MSEEALIENSQTLKGQDAFDLYKQGEAVWNAWSAKNTACDVDFSGWDFTKEDHVDFNAFIFPERGGVNFEKAQFGEGMVSFFQAQFGEGSVNFKKAQFGGYVAFLDTRFGKGHVSFEGAQFSGKVVTFVEARFGKGHVSFEGAQFGKTVVTFWNAAFPSSLYFTGVTTSIEASAPPTFDFSDVHFKSLAIFNRTVFDKVPDFRNSLFDREISLKGTKITYIARKTNCIGLPYADSDDASKYRRLRRLAIEAKDHDRELEYFSCELRAKFKNQLNIVEFIPIFAYRLFSNFGRSIARPLICLFITWIAAAAIFYSKSKNVLQVPNIFGIDSSFVDALLLSTSNLLPFIGWSSANRETHLGALFGEAERGGWVVQATGYGEGILALIFLFLFGLALRNTLRL
jgi:hypothetical protein